MFKLVYSRLPERAPTNELSKICKITSTDNSKKLSCLWPSVCRILKNTPVLKHPAAHKQSPLSPAGAPWKIDTEKFFTARTGTALAAAFDYFATGHSIPQNFKFDFRAVAAGTPAPKVALAAASFYNVCLRTFFQGLQLETVISAIKHIKNASNRLLVSSRFTVCITDDLPSVTTVISALASFLKSQAGPLVVSWGHELGVCLYIERRA
jgi:hypothetical protein